MTEEHRLELGALDARLRQSERNCAWLEGQLEQARARIKEVEDLADLADAAPAMAEALEKSLATLRSLPSDAFREYLRDSVRAAVKQADAALAAARPEVKK